MANLDIAQHRLHNQRLEGVPFEKPEEVVRWLGAVQAQDYAGAKWGLAQRLNGLTDADLDQAFADGAILRTHVMRPTWHFVTPADIRWLLELTAPRVQAVSAYMYRQLELDQALFARSNTALVKALEGGQQLTRAELGAVLARIGIVAQGQRLGYIMYYAELEGLLCSGGRRGKQFTYALLSERAPHAKRLARDEALAELTQRYFTSHGPATVHDFAWWSGLTIADVKAGLEMVKPQLQHEVVEGKTYWFAEAAPITKYTTPVAYLLPNYDEYTIGYTDHSAILAPQYAGKLDSRDSAVFAHVLVIDGQVVGTWRRTFSKGAAVIDLSLLRPLTAAENDALAVAAQRYSAFLKMPVKLP